MILFRKILFYLFTAIYLAVCPLLILYALGYVYNPLKQGLIRTGVIRLSTVPSGATVYLEQSRFTHLTPTTIEELLPGDYQVSLEKAGYKRWTQTVSIEAGKAAAFETVLLIPQQWPVTSLSKQRCTDIFPLEEHKQLLLTTNSTLDSCFLYGKKKPLRPLLTPESPLSELSVRNIEPVMGGKSFLLSGGSFRSQTILWLNPREEQPLPEDITELVSGRLPDFCWQAEDDEAIYIFRDQSIWRADLKTKQIAPRLLENIKGFGVYGRRFYVITSDGILIRSSFEAEEPKVLLEDASLVKRLFSKSEFYRIEVYNDEIIAFLGTRGDLVLNVPPYTIAAGDVAGFRFNENQDLLLCWTEDAIRIADFSRKSDETVFHERFTVRSVHENANNIKQCFWAWRDSHILCNDADTMYLIEIEPQGAAHVEPVCRIQRRTNVFYDEDETMLYYLEENTGRLTGLRILP